MIKQIYTIKKSDIGKGQLNSKKDCPCCGIRLWTQTINTMDFMGKIQPIDVGKRIYFNETGRCYQVENNKQLRERKANK